MGVLLYVDLNLSTNIKLPGGEATTRRPPQQRQRLPRSSSTGAVRTFESFSRFSDEAAAMCHLHSVALENNLFRNPKNTTHRVKIISKAKQALALISSVGPET